jgi:hypothetical protein
MLKGNLEGRIILDEYELMDVIDDILTSPIGMNSSTLLILESKESGD